jgi:hypothetical protein
MVGGLLPQRHGLFKQNRTEGCLEKAETLSAPVKPAATRVGVPPVELDCSRPKAESGKKP